jgi:SET domain
VICIGTQGTVLLDMAREMAQAKNHFEPNKVGYVSKILSQGGLITALQSAKGGVFVAAMKDLKKGTNVMECTAASIALDPPFRRSNCGYCATQHPKLHLCDKCRVIACCQNCASGVNRHKNECEALQALGKLLSENEDTGDPNIDSSHLLTLRILSQRQNLDWELSKCLHAVSLPEVMDSDIAAICAQLQATELSWVGNDIYHLALARVIGCSHAITDVSLPLGSQSIGRGMFPEHSFYNHSCAPNAFLSCNLMTRGHSDERISKDVTARVHLLSDIKAGDQVSISYIPTSGLGFQERQLRLHQGYEFVCDCDACLNQEILLPPNVDIDSIREIQFHCNERLLKLEDCAVDVDETKQIISLVNMTKRGIENQGIPRSHEISIESDRLLAMAYSLSGQSEDAIKYHQSFFSESTLIGHLFDPVAMATQRLTYADKLEGVVKTEQLQQAISALECALGENHPWVQHVARDVQNYLVGARTDQKEV